jgi:hypothetical protein
MGRIGLNREPRRTAPAGHHAIDQLRLVDDQGRLGTLASVMTGESKTDASVAVVVDDGAKDVNL